MKPSWNRIAYSNPIGPIGIPDPPWTLPVPWTRPTPPLGRATRVARGPRRGGRGLHLVQLGLGVWVALGLLMRPDFGEFNSPNEAPVLGELGAGFEES